MSSHLSCERRLDYNQDMPPTCLPGDGQGGVFTTLVEKRIPERELGYIP